MREKMRKKFISTLLCVVMAATMLTGCGKEAKESGSKDEGTAEVTTTAEATETPEELEFVTLKMLFPGSAPTDSDLVYVEKLKELTERDGLNCNLDIEYIAWADVATQYLVQLASGTPYDLVHISNPDYFSEARKGAFREITMEEIQKYMPETYAKGTSDYWRSVTVDGKIYAIPWYSGTVDSYMAAAIRQDKSEELGIEVTDIVSYENYMAAIKAEDPSAVPMKGAFDFQTIGWTQNYGFRGFSSLGYLFLQEGSDGELNYDNILLKYETPEYLEFCKMMRRWVLNGYVEQNASSATQDTTASFSAGVGYATNWNLGSLSNAIQQLKTADPTAVAKMVDLTPDATKYATGYMGQGYAITRNAENAERAMMLLDKFKNDKEYHDLSLIGIEGVHYNNVESDDKQLYYEQTENVANFPKFGTAMWGWYNKEWARYGTSDLEEYVNLDYSFENNSIVAKSEGFAFDNSSVQAEVAACKSISDQYNTILNFGMTDDIEGTIAECIAKMKESGYDTILDEFTKQYNEYIAQFD